MSDNSRQRLDELLAAFGQQAGMPGLATEGNGVCILVFDDRTHVNLLADAETSHLIAWSNLGCFSSEGAAATLRALMRANLFWHDTCGATLGLMPDSDEVVLAMRRPIDGLEVDGLRDVIELMVETAEALGPLARGEVAPSKALPAAPPAYVTAIRG